MILRTLACDVACKIVFAECYNALLEPEHVLLLMIKGNTILKELLSIYWM